MKFLKVIDDSIEKATLWVLVVSVLGMLSVTVLSIVLRWFNITFHWMEPFVRHLVFLSTFLGGVLATGRGTHIGIDILGKYLEQADNEKLLKSINFIINFVTFFVCIWLVKASYEFFKVEMQYGKPVFWGISSGYLVGITPLGFGIIAFRFLVRSIKSFSRDLEAK